MTKEQPIVSVVLCTWNRAALLENALAALVCQRDAPPHEIVVVDNASRDATARVIARFAEVTPALRAVREDRPGLSHARNTGVMAARGSLLAFTDDDVRVGERWVGAIVSTAARHPGAAFFGGPVRPIWRGAVPPWLTRLHWAPLGIQDYGSAVFRVDAQRPVCLIGANLVLRREALLAAGGFDAGVQRIGATPGSTEDHALHVRLWAAGLHGVYDPELTVQGVVGEERLRKAYHRRWHYGHGRHVARMRLPEVEASDRTLFGVPGHVLRRAADDAAGLMRGLVRGRHAEAFDHEARLWFAAGFLRERWS